MPSFRKKKWALGSTQQIVQDNLKHIKNVLKIQSQVTKMAAHPDALFS